MSPGVERPAAVLIEVAATVEVPFEVARARLLEHREAIVAGALGAAPKDTDPALAGRVGPFGPAGPGAQPVWAEVLGSQDLGDRVVLGLRWRPARAPQVLPSLEAEVVLASLGVASSELRLCGAYHPPGGSLGRSLDRLGLHRVGERTLRAVVRGMARGIQAMDPPVAQQSLVPCP